MMLGAYALTPSGHVIGNTKLRFGGRTSRPLVGNGELIGSRQKDDPARAGNSP